jgi:hypothetical protein
MLLLGDILLGIPDGSQLTRIFALFRPCCKTDARYGWLPAARAARTMVEEFCDRAGRVTAQGVTGSGGRGRELRTSPRAYVEMGLILIARSLLSVRD